MSSTAGFAVVAAWSDLWDDSHGPEDRAVRLLSAAGSIGAYDVGAVRRAYRRAIDQALPDGLQLRGSTFYGPAAGLRVQDGRLVPEDGRPLLALHRDTLERAVHGPAGSEGDGYFWQIADRHKLSADGLRLYGTWYSVTGEVTVEDTVRSALGAWGREHVQDLTDTGRYGIEVLRAALAGRFGSQVDVDQVAGLYREALAAALPPGFVLDSDALWGPHPLVEADVWGAVRDVDLDAVVAGYAAAPRELLTAAQVAELIGAASADSARHTLSRWGVSAAEYRAGDSGRVQARYDADQVREAQRSRPGRGRRTKPASG